MTTMTSMAAVKYRRGELHEFQAAGQDFIYLVTAGAIFDWQGSYDTFLYITMAAMLSSSLALGTIGKGRFAAGH